MVQKYKAVLTTAGAAKIAAATAGGAKVNLKQMAVGDGSGTLPMPDPAQTKLIAEKHRAVLNKVIVDPKHKNYLVAELVIPPEIGGFWMRELGLYDDSGALIAVSNMAESYKPLLSEGSGRAQTLRMVVIVSDMDSVNLQIDASTVLATQEYVDDKLLEHEQSRRHPDATLKEKGFSQLSSATNSDSESLAATPKSVKAAYDKAQTADNNAVKANDNANTRLEKNKNLAELTDKPHARKNLELGTAATNNVQKSVTDNTVNAVLTVGAFGLGSNSIPITTASNSDLSKMPAIPFNAIREYKSSDGSVYLIGMSGISPSGNLVEWLAPENGSDGKKLAVRNKDSLFILYSTANKPTANDVGAIPFFGQIPAGTNLNTLTNYGVWFNSANANATLALNYPSTQAGSLQILRDAGTTQIYTEYASGRQFRRGLYTGTWSPWRVVYDSGNKPSSDDVNAIARDGCHVAGFVNGAKDNPYMRHTSSNAVVRLLPVDTATAQFQPKGNYQPAGNYALAGASYTKAESDSRYYTKAQSDAGYQPKGNYALAGSSYSKAQSDARYVQGVQLGAEARMWSNTFTSEGVARVAKVPAGCTMTSVGDANASGNSYLNDIDFVGYKPIQRNINGTWVTISG